MINKETIEILKGKVKESNQEKLEDILKQIYLNPESGFGETYIKWENSKIVHCKVTKTVKFN